ncbi:MAG: class I tRNA ligase family protein, partial [Thermoplasmataceae archaeon]
MKVKDARDAVISDLLKSGDAFIMYETSRKAETRSGSKVVVAVLRDQWFIDYSPQWLKESGHRLVDSMFFFPEFYRKAMHDAIDWLRERPCARRRGIGTKLPFDRNWVIESLSDSTIYPAVYTNARFLEGIFRKIGTLPADILDHIFTGSDLANKYDSEILKLVEDAKAQMEYWYGVDIRLTTSPHISNHLAFYILNHAAIFPEKYQPKGLIISGLVVSNGSKISKSKGNAISLLDVTEHYSADLYRLFVVINADVATVLDWNEDDVGTVKRKYDDFIAVMNGEGYSGESSEPIEKWFESSFYMRCSTFFSRMERYDLRGAYIEIFFEVLNDIKYLIARGGNPKAAVQRIQDVWLPLLSPVIPHTCEELWAKTGHSGFVSSATIEPDFTSLVDKQAIMREEYLRKIVQDIREIMKATGINPETITITFPDRTTRTVAESIFSGRINDIPQELRFSVADFNRNRRSISMEFGDEKAILDENKGYLEKVFSCRVELKTGSISKTSKIPWPGRPVIQLS